VHTSLSYDDKPSAGGLLRTVLFTVTVTAAFALGIYSLFLASANAGKVQPLTTEGLLRTATAADAGKIEIALGDMAEQELVYVVMDTQEIGPDPYVVIAARGAAQALGDSGLAASVRLLASGDPDFTTIASQNSVTQLPAVLAVKKNGGIVLVTDDLNEINLLQAYYGVWGKTSTCDEAKSAIY
jgi:hypothetical protein